jgi:hypothetical protein
MNRGGGTGGVEEVREEICAENTLNIKDFDPLNGYSSITSGRGRVQARTSQLRARGMGEYEIRIFLVSP